MWKEIIEKAWNFLKFIFDDPENDQDWWSKFENIVLSAIGMVEATAEHQETESYQKRNQAIQIVLDALSCVGIHIPLPTWLSRMIIGLAIDAVVNFLNEKFGHDWLDKIPEIS